VPAVTHSFGALLPEKRVASVARDLAPLWEAHGLPPAPYAGSYDDLYLDIYPSSMQPQDRPHIPVTQHLRPAERPGATNADPEWHSDHGRPLIYVTFGTIFNHSTALRDVVEGARELDVQLLVTIGPDGDPNSLGPQPSNVHVRTYVPQQQVLGRCTAVVSHGGSGTFLAAAAASLPQLVVPQGADQYLNADACTRSGVGITLPEPASAVEVGQALSRLLEDPSFATAAEAVARDIEEMPSAADVAQHLIDRYRDTAAPSGS
jgi:UDP:flavonoid glycosyltransferase YjiC (YdhE family)